MGRSDRGAWAWAALAGCFLARSASANDLLTLYHLAQGYDATLQSALAQRDAVIEGKPQALAVLLPQISASTSVERLRIGEPLLAPQAITGPAGNDCEAAVGAQTQVCHGNARGYGLSLSQTLWSFQSFSQLREASAAAAAAQANLLAAQQSLMLRVAQAYFGILSARDTLATNRGARESFRTLLVQARAREQTGIGPRADSEQAQAYADATEQSVIDAQNAVDDAELVMAEVTGSAAAAIAPLREDIPLTAPDPASVDDWVAAALKDNPSVRASRLQVEASDQDINVQRGKGLPSVVLSGSRTRAWEDLTIGGNQADDQIGVSVIWPLFQGGAVASQIRQSRALWKQAVARNDSLQRDTERTTRSSYRGVVTGISRIQAARRSAKSWQDAVEATRRNVEFGTGVEFNLLDAQNNYYVAQRVYSQTRYDYLTALLTLKQQAGRLAESDLETIDALLVEPAL